MREEMDVFLELLTPLKQSLVGYIRHLLWNKNDLEDALQNVLTEGWRKFSQFEKKTNFKNWIFQIATFTVFNMNRRYEKETSKEQSLSAEAESIPLMRDGKGKIFLYPFAFESLLNEEDYRKLLGNDMSLLDKISDEAKASLRFLNQKERSVFLLRSIGELSYAEIADILKMPSGSVMAYLSRARAKLRQQLTDYAKKAGYL